MISKQASILPRRLIRRYHTNDPQQPEPVVQVNHFAYER